MKKVIILMLILLSADSIFARYRIFDIKTILTQTKEPYPIEIKNNTDIDSLMKELKIINKDYDNYFLIDFENMNEYQIDEFDSKFPFRRFVTDIRFIKCPIKELPLCFRKYVELTSLSFTECHSIESLENVNFYNPIFYFEFTRCNINQLPIGIEKWKSMLNLIILVDDNFDNLDLNNTFRRLSIRNNLVNLYVYYKNIKTFPEELFKLTSLRNLVFFVNPKINSVKTDKLINLIRVESNLEDSYFLEPSLLKDVESYYSKDSLSPYMHSYISSDVFFFSNFYEKDELYLYRDEDMKHIDSTRKAVMEQEFNHEYKFATWETNFKIDDYKFDVTYNQDDRFFKIKCDVIKETDEVLIIVKDNYSGQEFLRQKMIKNEEYIIDVSPYPNIYFDMILKINEKESVYKLRVGK